MLSQEYRRKLEMTSKSKNWYIASELKPLKSNYRYGGWAILCEVIGCMRK